MPARSPSYPGMANPLSSRSDHAGPLAPVAEAPARYALFLDIDGTLLELAPTPEAITVPPDLPQLLAALSARLGGALALVTGRALPFADQLFAPLSLPIAGLHGAERRTPDGSICRPDIPPAFAQLKRDVQKHASSLDGVLIEDKGAALGAHYRLAPEHRGAVEALMQEAAREAGPDFVLQFGKMVVELRPASASKGEALRAFLAEPPFAGRLPVAIGDDVTDEAMFAVANRLGGHSIRIGPADAPTAARATIESVSALRAALKSVAEI